MGQIRATLRNLPRRLRAAFAGACAERARQVYEAAEDDSEFFFDALELVWDFAMGVDVEAGFIERARARVQQIHDDRAAAREPGFQTDALRSLLAALDSVVEATPAGAEDAAGFALDMVERAASSEANAALAAAEEETWQRAVLALLVIWPKPAVDVDTFEPIGWTETDFWPAPSWIDRVVSDDSW